MKKYIIAIAALLALESVVNATDITLRQVRDPVQLKAWMEANISDVSGTATNIDGASIVSGNIAAARITNALATAGQYVKGNIPVASITNALGGANYTNSITSGTNVNTIIVINGVITSWTTGN